MKTELVLISICKRLLNFIRPVSYTHLNAVGHRIVHGGEYFNDSAVVDEDVVSKVEELCELAPLHLSVIHI